MKQQTRTKEMVEAHLRKLGEEAGGDPNARVFIKPNDGGWLNALSYNLVTKDGRSVRIFRRHLDDCDDGLAM